MPTRGQDRCATESPLETSRGRKAARTATTRANSTISPRLFLLLDMAHSGRVDAPRWPNPRPFFWRPKSNSQEILLPT